MTQFESEILNNIRQLNHKTLSKREAMASSIISGMLSVDKLMDMTNDDRTLLVRRVVLLSNQLIERANRDD